METGEGRWREDKELGMGSKKSYPSRGVEEVVWAQTGA